MSDTLVIDTSVFIAILVREPEAADFSTVIRSHRYRLMSAASYVECAMVAGRWRDGRTDLDAWAQSRKIDIAPVDHAIAQRAADAFALYGKGRHPAALNFGDCFSYALAMSLDAPLLFKGNDFSKTNVVPALP